MNKPVVSAGFSKKVVNVHRRALIAYLQLCCIVFKRNVDGMTAVCKFLVYFNGLRAGGSCFVHCFQTAFSNMLYFLHLRSMSESRLWQFHLLTAFVPLLRGSKLARQHCTIRESLCPPSVAFVRLCATAHSSLLPSRTVCLGPRCSCQWVWKNGLITLFLQMLFLVREP